MDLLNLAAEERVNLADLSFALTDSILGQGSELAQGLLLPAAGSAGSSVVSGFVPMAAASGGPVTVGQSSTVNSAFLCRLGADGTLHPAELIYGGNSVVSLDISTFPTNTYGIYIRANRTAQTVQNRAFWSGVDASEYAQLTPTRLTASWEVRIETASPGAEWLLIGQAQVTAASAGGQGATVTVTDQRPLFFEGAASAGYQPAWGTAADRGARQSSTITNLATMVDALKQCVVDIKGRGLATWSQPNISGLQVGSSFTLASTPTADRLSIGDENFYLSLTRATASQLAQGGSDSLAIALNGTSDGLIYARNSAFLSRVAQGANVLTLYNQGGATFGAGPSSGYVTIFAAPSSTRYGLSIWSADASTPATLGLNSANATSASIELGQKGFTNGYGLIRATWSSTPTLSFYVNGIGFLSASNFNGSGPSTVTLTGNVNLPNSTSLGTYPVPRAQVLWSAGVYSPGANGSANGTIYSPVGQTPTAVAQQVNGYTAVVLTFPSALPPSCLVSVSSFYDATHGKVFQAGAQTYGSNGNQIVVGSQNADNDPVNAPFTFFIYYGS